jgi:hypothetical protein
VIWIIILECFFGHAGLLSALKTPPAKALFAFAGSF